MNKKNTINVLSQIQLQVSEFDLQGWVEHNKGLTIFLPKFNGDFFLTSCWNGEPNMKLMREAFLLR